MKEHYLIGQVARMMNVSSDTLRYYDKRGIVSPKKDHYTGYRYYTLEDLFALSYVLTFRDLDLPLDTIQSLMTNNRLEDFNILIDQQLSLIEKKINHFSLLREKLNTLKTHIETVHRMLGHAEVTYNPPLIYHSLKTEWDEGYADKLAEMESNPFISAPTPAILINHNDLLNATFKVPLVFCISGIVNDLTTLNSLSSYNYIPPQKCIHTVIQTQEQSSYEQTTKNYLPKLEKYLSTHHLTLSGTILASTIAFEHIDNSPYEYYELWIPVNNY
ncbi:MAG: MerR family transcriptional regulator [Cellulosilyticaceae bacterium]